ncbi:hypothetical protein, partial [Escherichia coli]|uniref:hypothetical protein n=1 Tax=Escherichia coli TaxID=562 RepID=UPI0013D3D4E3
MAHILLVAGVPGTARRLQNGRVDPGSYWAEPIQSAVVRAMERDRAGIEALPATTDELAVVLARHARHINDNTRARTRRHLRHMEVEAELRRRNPEAYRTRSFLHEIIARDLFQKFAARLFDELDHDARRLLD